MCGEDEAVNRFEDAGNVRFMTERRIMSYRTLVQNPVGLSPANALITASASR